MHLSFVAFKSAQKAAFASCSTHRRKRAGHACIARAHERRCHGTVPRHKVLCKRTEDNHEITVSGAPTQLIVFFFVVLAILCGGFFCGQTLMKSSVQKKRDYFSRRETREYTSNACSHP